MEAFASANATHRYKNLAAETATFFHCTAISQNKEGVNSN